MTVREELELIKAAREEIAELDLKKRKIYDCLIEKIDSANRGGRLEASIWDYVINGVRCYIYDIEQILKNRKKALD